MAQSSKDIPKGSSPLRNLRGQLIGYQTPSGKKVYFKTSQGEAPIKPIATGSGKLVPGTQQENLTTTPWFLKGATYSGNNVYLNDKFVGTMVDGKFKPKVIGTSKTDVEVEKDKDKYGNTFPEGSFSVTKQQIKINQKDPDTPSEPVVETTESDTLAASEVTKPPSQRELLIKEARTKYKDSPFKQWAHANQKLAMALKPNQVGYAQVQEYFKEQKGKLKVKPQEKPFIKPNATKIQMGPGANDLRGYSSTIA